MVERKFKKWQLAFIVGLIFIIPVILVFQYTKADITIPIISQGFVSECSDDGKVCAFNSNSNKILSITEDDRFWTISGNCFILGDDFNRNLSAEFTAFPPPEGILFDTITFGQDECVNFMAFEKDEYVRQIINIDENSIDVFTLRTGTQELDTARFIESVFGG